MKKFNNSPIIPPGFPSQGAYDFYCQVQAATGNYYEPGAKGFWHLTNTMKGFGYDWQILNNNADDFEACLAAITDHCRNRRIEKMNGER